MNGVISAPLDLISPALTADTLRRLQGQFDLALADAIERRAAARSLRERVAVSLEVQLYADAIARCRLVRAAHNRNKGWQRTRPRPAFAGSPVHQAHPRDGAGRTPAVGPAPAGKVAGVVGAEPPPVMGHGWPASPGAGRAASAATRASGQRVSREAPARPSGDPSFGR